jgi:hypothetical protein
MLVPMGSCCRYRLPYSRHCNGSSGLGDFFSLVVADCSSLVTTLAFSTVALRTSGWGEWTFLPPRYFLFIFLVSSGLDLPRGTV